MEEGTTRGILLVADISGYTEFVRLHARSASHARQIVVRLLRAIISAAGPPLVVAELDGDAVFFYALAEEDGLGEVAKQVRERIPRLFRAFTKEMKVLSTRPNCSCRACSSIGDLRLKQVVHAGEVATEKIDRFEKLFGLEVIVVHRMLKNTVPAREYLMLSEPAFSVFDGFFGLDPEHRMEELEGIGTMGMRVFYSGQLASVQDQLDEVEGPLPDPSLLEILRWKVGVGLRTFVGRLTRRNGRARANLKPEV
jgi:Protein of unknown function (DUF2652)